MLKSKIFQIVILLSISNQIKSCRTDWLMNLNDEPLIPVKLEYVSIYTKDDFFYNSTTVTKEEEIKEISKLIDNDKKEELKKILNLDKDLKNKALLIAAQKMKIEMFKLLIDIGADRIVVNEAAKQDDNISNFLKKLYC